MVSSFLFNHFVDCFGCVWAHLNVSKCESEIVLNRPLIRSIRSGREVRSRKNSLCFSLCVPKPIGMDGEEEKNRWHINPIRIWTQFSLRNPWQTNNKRMNERTQKKWNGKKYIYSESDLKPHGKWCAMQTNVLPYFMSCGDVRQCQIWVSFVEYVHSFNIFFSFFRFFPFCCCFSFRCGFFCFHFFSFCFVHLI